MNKKNFFRRMLSVVASFALGVSALGTSVAFAAETDESALLTDESTAPIVIEADDGVVVIITPISDDSVPSVRAEQPINTYFDFHGSLYGTYRYFSGNHFSVDMTTSSSTGSGNFTFKLMRQGTFWDTTVGTANLPQNGSFHVEFLNVYNANWYRFYFEQYAGQSSHQTGQMTIYNWD